MKQRITRVKLVACIWKMSTSDSGQLISIISYPILQSLNTGKWRWPLTSSSAEVKNELEVYLLSPLAPVWRRGTAKLYFIISTCKISRRRVWRRPSSEMCFAALVRADYQGSFEEIDRLLKMFDCTIIWCHRRKRSSTQSQQLMQHPKMTE
jgi:hypothetical protein